MNGGGRGELGWSGGGGGGLMGRMTSMRSADGRTRRLGDVTGWSPWSLKRIGRLKQTWLGIGSALFDVSLLQLEKY